MSEEVVLPVYSWEASQFTFGSMYPGEKTFPGMADPKPYMSEHSHRHPECGHVSLCPHNWSGEPCQAYEWMDKLCAECGQEKYLRCRATCPEWDVRRSSQYTKENNYGHNEGCPYIT